MLEEAPLTLRGVSRSFGTKEVLSNMDLVVREGERAIVLGANGSGKTTLLRMVTGTLGVTSGEISIGGCPAGTAGAKAQLGASLTQGRGFYGRLTARENLLVFARLRMSKAAAFGTVAALEDELELGEIAPVRAERCSAGMLAQIAFARALLGEPQLVVLDEPTRSLDENARRRLWSALERRPTTAALIATHLDDDLDHGTTTLLLGEG